MLSNAIYLPRRVDGYFRPSRSRRSPSAYYPPSTLSRSPCVPLQVKAKEERIRALAADPRIYDRLVASMAPNVWEMEDVKKGLMCQLFGGSCKVFPGGRIRGEINLLLVSDGGGCRAPIFRLV